MGLFFLIFLFNNSCNSPIRTVTKDFGSSPKINKIHIEAIDFYLGSDFTKLAPKHPYMETSRGVIKKLAKDYLSPYGLELIDDWDESAVIVWLEIGITFIPSRIYYRVWAFYKQKLIFKIDGSEGCKSLHEDHVIEAQEEIAKKVAAIFNEKLNKK